MEISELIGKEVKFVYPSGGISCIGVVQNIDDDIGYTVVEKETSEEIMCMVHPLINIKRGKLTPEKAERYIKEYYDVFAKDLKHFVDGFYPYSPEYEYWSIPEDFCAFK